MLVAAAYNLHSLQNVGSIFRTADGAGFGRVLLAGHTGSLPDKRISKVALGAEEALESRHVGDLHGLLRELEGAFVILLEQAADSVPPTDLPPLPDDRDIVLVACDELYGAGPELVERADAIVELPMRGMKQSLNVAIAWGIAAYAIADRIEPFTVEGLRSRQPARPVRDGVLTRGRTAGEVPGVDPHGGSGTP